MTNSFFAALTVKLEPLQDGRRWRLLEPFWFHLMMKGISCKITVSAGFVTDFASVPRPFWFLYPPAGTKGNPYGIAALFHDWLCAHRKIAGRVITFSQANSVFLEIMLYLGCRRTLAWTMYLAVQGPFGWWLWKKRKVEDIIP